MASTPIDPSPLKNPQSHYGFEGCLPTDGSGFPYGGFWKADRYYESNCVIRLQVRTEVDPQEDERVTFTALNESIDGGETEVLSFPAGTYWVCERVSERPLTNSGDMSLTGTYVTLCTLHPANQRLVRGSLWPHADSRLSEQFSPVENEMLIIALAATGLAL